MIERSPLVEQLLNAMGDGCVVLNQEGLCQGAFSASAAKIFEKDPTNLHFTKILSLPEPEAGQMKDWFKFLFSKKTRFEDICTLGPTKYLHSNAELTIRIQFKPFRNASGEVENVAMIANDVSSTIAEKKRGEAQRQEAEMLIARYRNFPAFARCLELYQECVQHLDQFQDHKDNDKVEELRREIHSLKGILGICSLSDLVSTVKHVEQKFLDDRKNQNLSATATKSLAASLRKGHAAFMEEHAEALSLGRFAKDTYRVVHSEKIDHFRSWLKTMSASPEVVSRFSNYFCRMSLEEILEPLKMFAALQGARLQKPVAVQVECPEVYFEPTILDSVLPAISKAITSAIQDSIEDVEERQMADKPREGQILLAAAFEGDRLTVSVQDDGKLAKKVPFHVQEKQQDRKVG